MGYQIGNTCYSSKEEAENLYFSSVIPVIDSDNKIQQPVYNANGWNFNGVDLKVELPECDPLKNFNEGSEIGWLLFGVMAGMYVFILIRGQLR